MNRLFRNVARRFAREERGSVILETALMLMILLLFAFGIIDFGRVMYVSNALTSVTRGAARWAAVQSAVPTAATIKDSVCRPFNGAACGSTGGSSFRFGGPGLQATDVAVTPPNCGASPPVNTVTILTSYPFNWLTPLPRLMRWTTSSSPFTTTIHAQAIFKYEWC